MKRLHIRGLRSRLLLIVVAGATVLTAALTIGFNGVVRAHLESQANDLLKQRADAHVAALTLKRGRIDEGSALDDAAQDQPFWIYEGTRVVQRPAVAAAAQRAADSLARGKIGFRDVPAADMRLFSDPIVDVRHSRRRIGTIVAAVSLTSFERTERAALLASLVIAAMILMAIFVSTRLVLSGALGPIDRLTAEAAERTEHDLDRRFDLGEPHDELTHLAATFDQLRGRIAAVLRHERNFTGEIAHELRTPLAKVIGEAELAMRHERSRGEYRQALESIGRYARSMQRTLDSLLATARINATGAAGIGDARRAAARAASAHAPGATERGVRVEVDPTAERLRVDASTEVIERMLAPLVDNGCRHAERLVTIAVGQANGHVDITVADDGQGVAVGDRERIFEPGVRLDVEGRHAGAGLGLALARRLARSAGGEIECLPGSPGARFRLRLPAV